MKNNDYPEGSVRRYAFVLLVAAGASALFVLAGPADAETEARRRAGGGWVGVCKSGSSDARKATEALNRLRTKLFAEDPRPTVESITDDFASLLQLRCMEVISHLEDEPPGGSVQLIREWWHDGGDEWLWQVARGSPDGGLRSLTIPPEPRWEVWKDTTDAGSALARLACQRDDERCGRETLGWMLRAEAAFEAHRFRERHEMGNVPMDDRQLAECAELARAKSHRERFREWYGCVSSMRLSEATLPLGRIRAPKRGQLMLRGRRGHYDFCDETRSYDLANGTAKIEASCSELVLERDGKVDGAATHARRRESVTIGHVPIDAIREAAWMLLLASDSDITRTRSIEVPIPRDVRPRLWVEGADGPWTMGFIGGRSAGWSSSNQTTLMWTWRDGDRELAKGRLTWPASSDGAESHAAFLFRVAEAGLEE